MREANATEDFHRRWANLMVVEVDEAIASRAGELVPTFPLRGADAIQLASAQFISLGAEPLTFACWDRRLWAAAQGLGFEVVPIS